MSNDFTFQSLGRPPVGYRFGRYEYGQSQGIASVAQEFQTYGDGLVQHSPSSPVHPENFYDFLISLAAKIVEDPSETVIEVIDSAWPRELSYKEVVAALKVKDKEGVVQYYDTRDYTVSRSAGKMHDRRYEKVPDWANGTVLSAIRLMSYGHSLLRNFKMVLQVADINYRLSDRYYSDSQLYGPFQIPGDAYQNTLAFTIVDRLVEGYRQVESGKGSFKRMLEHQQRVREEAEKIEATKAEVNEVEATKDA